LKPETRFLKKKQSFWAAVRIISQHVGYTQRKQKSIKIPSFEKIYETYVNLGFNFNILGSKKKPTRYFSELEDYFKYRADILNNYVEPRLMDIDRAKEVFEDLKLSLNPECIVPMNKQKGDKKAPAYFTGIINLLIEYYSNNSPCDYDPRELTSITRDGKPIRTLSRRVDGAFPQAVNPLAIWEIKEYYYTTTFGSRVADGVYETLLDGLELHELREHEGIDVKHYLMVDSHYTWWECGRSYLCRIIDMLHMGLVDEVLFGYEVVEQLPELVKTWLPQI
jgi:hypothetical protein